jgi:hypothetical protein
MHLDPETLGLENHAEQMVEFPPVFSVPFFFLHRFQLLVNQLAKPGIPFLWTTAGP